jgi:glutathione S-transferase
VVPETIAIIEYLHDKYPAKGIWPSNRIERALARAAAAEMHGGFTALRNAAPMNLKASHPGKVDLDEVAGDLKRIERLWGDLISRSGGPYLFGQFTAADAMFAPVATRIRTYELPVTDLAMEYVEAIYALPAFQEWFAEAVKEPWVVEQDEIDSILARRDLAKKEAAGHA